MYCNEERYVSMIICTKAWVNYIQMRLHLTNSYLFHWPVGFAFENLCGEEIALKASGGAMVNPDERHQYRNKGDKPFKMICGVPQ